MTESRELVGQHHQLSGHESLNKHQEIVKDREAWLLQPMGWQRVDTTQRLSNHGSQNR